MHFLAVSLLACALSGCLAHAGARPTCAKGDQYQRSELYFGLRRSDGSLIESAEFDAFLEREIVRSLSSGFTLFSAEGRYFAGGSEQREPSRVLVVLHRGQHEIDAALEDARMRYKTQFAQQSVLRTDSPTCLSF
jgi:Protein of unknown function (DUF3574)